MLKKVSLLYHTLRHLKKKQISYRLYFFVRNKSKLQKDHYKIPRQEGELKAIRLSTPIDKPISYAAPHTFRFLNLEKMFEAGIDWNYSRYGKLWTYNLNYFDFLNQSDMTREEGLRLLHDYIASEPALLDGKEAYTTSLRVVNWLKFMYKHDIRDQQIHDFMLCDLSNINANLEYHILANHLLENAFALTIGGYCLNQNKIFEKGFGLLVEQLDEQICKDGAHYEKSPMYQQILLDRLLDTINILNGYDHSSLLGEQASKMLSWLSNITFADDSIPYVNDSTPGIAPSTMQLTEYAESLGVVADKTKLGNSFYRKFSNGSYEMVADCGGVSPKYQPAHSHNDAGSFVLQINNKPFIVDTGISTYEANDRRHYERSVTSHNTSHPVDTEPNEIWGSFRVARRETVEITSESSSSLEVKRTLPYKGKCTLVRSFLLNEKIIEISDKALSANGGGLYQTYLHFAPHVEISKTKTGISTPGAEVILHGHTSFDLLDCQVCSGYNKLETTKKLKISFEDVLRTEIKLKE